MPKISVIMPLYNAEQYVKKAIGSILQQSYKDFELLIIDDCSTDNTLEVVSSIKNPKIKIVSNEKNKGIAYSRNKGLDLAESEYIALMDDDDLTVSNRFELQNDYLESYVDIDVVGGRHCAIDQKDQIIQSFMEPLNNPQYIRAYLMFYNAIANGSTMIRNDFLKKNHIKYADDCLGMEDYRFWIDCSVKGKITNLSEVLLYWRKSGTNETSKINDNWSISRADKYADLQRYALGLNGYSLLEEEYGVLNNMFPEIITSSIVNVKDMKQLYNVFLKIIRMSKEMRVENENEVKILCRKLFSSRLEFSDFWF